MSLQKFASFQILSVSRAGERDRIFRTAHRAEFNYTPRPGFLYVRSRAISSRCNDNFDEFPADEIKKAYRTFVGKPVFVNHNNDKHRRARGVIIDAALHEDTNKDGTPDTWAEVLMEVDAVHFPKLAEAIVKGHIERTSMGTDVEYSICSFCHNKAYTPAEYCKHIPRLKGKRIRRFTGGAETEDVLVSEICYGLGFFENSLLVEDPADPTAYFLGVDTRGLLASKSSFGGRKLSTVYTQAGEKKNPDREIEHQEEELEKRLTKIIEPPKHPHKSRSFGGIAIHARLNKSGKPSVFDHPSPTPYERQHGRNDPNNTQYRVVENNGTWEVFIEGGYFDGMSIGVVTTYDPMWGDPVYEIVSDDPMLGIEYDSPEEALKVLKERGLPENPTMIEHWRTQPVDPIRRRPRLAYRAVHTADKSVEDMTESIDPQKLDSAFNTDTTDETMGDNSGLDFATGAQYTLSEGWLKNGCPATVRRDVGSGSTFNPRYRIERCGKDIAFVSIDDTGKPWDAFCKRHRGHCIASGGDMDGFELVSVDDISTTGASFQAAEEAYTVGFMDAINGTNRRPRYENGPLQWDYDEGFEDGSTHKISARYKCAICNTHYPTERQASTCLAICRAQPGKGPETAKKMAANGVETCRKCHRQIVQLFPSQEAFHNGGPVEWMLDESETDPFGEHEDEFLPAQTQCEKGGVHEPISQHNATRGNTGRLVAARYEDAGGREIKVGDIVGTDCGGEAGHDPGHISDPNNEYGGYHRARITSISDEGNGTRLSYEDADNPGHGIGGTEYYHVHKLGNMRTRAIQENEVKAPPEVDTLRDTTCPICGDENFNGEQCAVCLYIKPPDMFMDPDVEMAKSVDLRGDVTDDEAEGGLIEDSNKLVCDTCNAEVALDTGTDVGTEFNAQQAPPERHDIDAPPPAANNNAPAPPPAPGGTTGIPTPQPDDNAEPPAGKELPKPKDDQSDVDEGKATQNDVDDEKKPTDTPKADDSKGKVSPDIDTSKEDDDAKKPPFGGDDAKSGQDDTSTNQDAAKEISSGGGFKEGDTCPECGKGTLQRPSGSAPSGGDDASAPAKGGDADTNPFAQKSGDDTDSKDADAPKSGDDADDDEKSDDADEDDDPDSKKKKPNPFDKKSSAGHSADAAISHQAVTYFERLQAEGVFSMPRPLMKVAAEQQTLIMRLRADHDDLRREVAFLRAVNAKLCEVAGIRIIADEENPAQPVAQDGAGAPAETSDGARKPDATEDVTNVGASPLTDVAPDATEKLTDVGGTTLFTAPASSQVVTTPVTGTEDRMPYDMVVTRPQQSFIDEVRPDTAFPLQGDFAQKPSFGGGGTDDSSVTGPSTMASVSEGRTYASIRLARLQIQAGLASPDLDEITLAHAIGASTASDEQIQHDIAQLTAVLTANREPSPRTARRDLVPRTAGRVQRSAPSMSDTEPQYIEHRTASVTDDELLCDLGPSFLGD